MQKKLWFAIRDSFWFVPTIYGAASILLVFGLGPADAWILSNFQDQIPKMLITGKNIAMQLYASLVTAILTMTTISFSVIMVVLTTYSTQFSPRTMQDFMRSKMVHHVIGVFSFGFIFALLHLLLVGKSDTLIGPILMVVIAIICLALFVFFIHRTSQWVQVNHLIGKIYNDSLNVITQLYAKPEYEEHEHWNEDELDQLKQRDTCFIYAEKTGYVQNISWQLFIKWNARQECTAEVFVHPGDFVVRGMPILKLMKTRECKNLNEAVQFIIIGNERTDISDVEFVLQKLVEIAMKAISPSVNDPHTAIKSMNRIGALLGELGKRYKEISYLTDEDDNLRIIKYPKRFEDYLYKSFYQIKHYAAGDVSVYYNMFEVLYRIALVNDKSIKRKVWSFHFYIRNAIEWDQLQELDYKQLESIRQQLEDCCKE